MRREKRGRRRKPLSKVKENNMGNTGADGHHIPPGAYGISEEEAQGLYEGVRGKRRDWEHFTPEFVGTKVQEFSLEDSLEHMRRSTEMYEKSRLSQIEAAIYFRNNYPISIFFLGDVHYGSIYTDHDRFMWHLKQIVDTPNCYVAFMSNMIDNAIPGKFPDGMLANGLPPDKQVMALRRIAMDLNARGKLLGAVTSPCHEGWTFKNTGQDVNALMFGFDGRQFPVLENGGRLYLKFPLTERVDDRIGTMQDGYQNVTVALYHQCGPFESSFNEEHALRQMNRLRQRMEADVVVGAHRHTASAKVVYEGAGERVKPVAYVRSGTYKGITKNHDQFAIGRLGTTGQPSGQSVTLCPSIGLMSANLDFDSGMMMHQGAMHRYALMMGE